MQGHTPATGDRAESRKVGWMLRESVPIFSRIPGQGIDAVMDSEGSLSLPFRSMAVMV